MWGESAREEGEGEVEGGSVLDTRECRGVWLFLVKIRGVDSWCYCFSGFWIFDLL